MIPAQLATTLIERRTRPTVVCRGAGGHAPGLRQLRWARLGHIVARTLVADAIGRVTSERNGVSVSLTWIALQGPRR